MEEIDFTIITPSYNYVDFIREMLESVIAQTDVTYEHLVYDAGSTDGTLDVIREFDHVQLTVEPDKGMSDAINKGFKAAKGTWVMWLNTDDKLLPGALSAVKEFASQNPAADVIHGAWDFIDALGKHLQTMQAVPFQRLTMIHNGCYIASTATFIRRETVLDEGNLLNERFKCVMDGEYYVRLSTEGKKFVNFPKVLAQFRLHGNNISMRHRRKSNMEDALTFQLHCAESRAIKRVYTYNFFKTEYPNGVVDCILHYFFRSIKVVMKLCNPPKR